MRLLIFVSLLVAVGAVSEECSANPDGTSTCAGVDQTALLQGRVRISKELDAKDEPQIHSYGPFATSKTVIMHFKGWAQGAIESRLAKLVPAGELATLESDSATLSAGTASELFEAVAMQQCPEHASVLQTKAGFQLLHAESTEGVHHVLLRGKGTPLQYMASHRSADGQLHLLVADPPVCSSMAQLASVDGDPALVGAPSLLRNTDQLVEDCKKLFVRTTQENCIEVSTGLVKNVTIEVTSATLSIIDGFVVHMIAQICDPVSHQCRAHHPECDFELPATPDANLLETSPLPEETMGLRATLKLHVALCDASEKDGVSAIEAEDDAFLLEYGMGELSLYKGFEHVYDDFPKFSALEIDAPEQLDFREQYSSCFPALSGKKKGTETMRNQGTCGSCWAFAGATSAMVNMCVSDSSAGKTLSKKNTDDRFEVSVQKLMTCIPDGGAQADAWGCDGGHMGKFDQQAKSWGLTKERDNLYRCGAGNSLDHFEIAGDCNTWPWKGTCTGMPHPDWWWGGIARLSGEETMKTWLAGGVSLSVSFDVYQNFFGLSANSIYTETSGAKSGGHSVNCPGYGIHGGVKYWILQNSWGTDWADQGYGKMLRGTDLCQIETVGVFAVRAWVTGGTQPPCPGGQCPPAKKGGKAVEPTPTPAPTPPPTPAPCRRRFYCEFEVHRRRRERRRAPTPAPTTAAPLTPAPTPPPTPAPVPRRRRERRRRWIAAVKSVWRRRRSSTRRRRWR